MKLLIGSLTWCPPYNKKREEIIVNYLELMAETYSKNEFDWLIIDNNTESPVLQKAIDRYKNIAQIIRNPVNYGWAVGRNQMMQVFDKSDSSLLAMMDCDMFYPEIDWPTRTINAYENIPWLHVFTLRKFTPENEGEYLGMIQSEKGISVARYRDLFGMTTVIDKLALKTLGGYDWKVLPATWGWHDIEYGLRIVHANLMPQVNQLDSLMGVSLDPLMMTTVEHRHTNAYDVFQKSFKDYHRDKLFAPFLKQQEEYRKKTIPVFFDYNEMPEDDYFITHHV